MKSIKKIIKIVILVIGIVFALLIAIGMLVDGDILKIEENDVSIEYTPKDIGNYVNFCILLYHRDCILKLQT